MIMICFKKAHFKERKSLETLHSDKFEEKIIQKLINSSFILSKMAKFDFFNF